MKRILLAIALVASACGGSSNPVEASTSTSTTAPTTTSTPAVDAGPLDSYRFVMTLAVEPEGGEATVVDSLEGEAILTPPATRIFGTVGGETLDLVTDGIAWWDLAEPGLDVTAGDVSLYLGFNGFLRPGDIAGLIADAAKWEDLGTDLYLDVPVMHLRRTGIVRDVDWDFGDVAQLDVWIESDDDIVKLVARWATGDNTGFPISTWEITERNPDITIPIPG